MLPKFSRTGTPLGRDNLVVSEHRYTIFCFRIFDVWDNLIPIYLLGIRAPEFGDVCWISVFWIFEIYLIPIYWYQSRLWIPAFGVLDFWMSISVCTDFRYGYVSDFRFGFIWISGEVSCSEF